MISNPTRQHVTGSESEAYTYIPGKILYHFSPRDCGLSRVLDHNLILFADDEAHASEILVGMFEHKLTCLEKLRLSDLELGIDRYTHEFAGSQPKYLLENKDKWTFSLAPTNQMYKVGWADNDTF